MQQPLQKVDSLNDILSDFGEICLCKFNDQLLIVLADPDYVVAPVLPSRSGREEMKKLFAGLTPYLSMGFSVLPACFT